MKEVRRVLLWEIIRYSPDIFFALEASSQAMRNQLCSDVSYIHFFLEENYGQDSIRSLDFGECREILKSRLQSQPFLYFLEKTTKSVGRYNVIDNTYEKIRFRKIPSQFDTTFWTVLDYDNIFICGKLRDLTYGGQTCKLTFSTKRVTQLASLHPGRCSAGVEYYRNQVYVFGGFNNTQLKSCHQYNIKENNWSDLPDLPELLDWGTTAILKNLIYISGYGWATVFEFNPQEINFRPIPLAGIGLSYWRVFVYQNILYLQSENWVHKIEDDQATRLPQPSTQDHEQSIWKPGVVVIHNE